MIKLYGMDADLLKDKDLYAYAYEKMPSYRKEKIDAIKYDDGKRLSLAAGFLLTHALKEQGYEWQQAKVETGEHGKPYIVLENGSSFFFNLTHSGHLAFCALADSEIGVDAEYIREKDISDSLIKKVCSEKEITFFEKMASEEAQNPSLNKDSNRKKEVFYKLWTIKESVMKQNGLGMSMNPKTIDAYEGIENDSFFCSDKKIKVFRKNEYFISVCRLSCENADMPEMIEWVTG